MEFFKRIKTTQETKKILLQIGQKTPPNYYIHQMIQSMKVKLDIVDAGQGVKGRSPRLWLIKINMGKFMKGLKNKESPCKNHSDGW